MRYIRIVVLAGMALFSFTNLFGLNIAGISVWLGVLFFFINMSLNKQPFAGSGLDFNAISVALNIKHIWFWIALPLIMDAVSIGLAITFLPQYIEHVLTRAQVFISLDNVAILIPHLAILALGEEIAWRAFFQKQLHRSLPIVPTLLFSSFLFAIGHIATGSPMVVAYDVFFVFINSILYGIVFHKTNNAWVSAISHFLANLFSVIVLIVL